MCVRERERERERGSNPQQVTSFFCCFCPPRYRLQTIMKRRDADHDDTGCSNHFEGEGEEEEGRRKFN